MSPGRSVALAAYRPTCGTETFKKHFAMLEMAADWHEPVVLPCATVISIAHANELLDMRSSHQWRRNEINIGGGGEGTKRGPKLEARRAEPGW